MDNENLLQKYPTFFSSKTQRSSSLNQNSQKKEIAQQIQPQALLKKLEEILQQRQSKFNQEHIKKAKGGQCKGDYTERIQGKRNVQKLLEDEKCKTDLQNSVTEKKERKSAHPNLKSLQPSAQNLFDIFSHDCNSRNPTSTNRSKKCKNSPKKGRANVLIHSFQEQSIIEGQNVNERDKLTLIQLNQHIQMQNNHLNEQLRFEQSQNTKLSLQMINMSDQITVLTKYSIFLFRIIKRELETIRLQR